MAKFSVKKPLTVFVVVIVIIALGIVSLLKMTPDLIPEIDLPYMVVMTTYVGATPEEVEKEVTKPLEQSLATLENLKNIQSVSSANYSMIIMEFENGSDMDSAVVDTLQSVDLVEGSWDDAIGSPYIMKINPTMIPIAVAAVDMEGYTTEEISDFVSDTLMNELEGITGVASISTGGLVETQLNVMINEKKIDKLNNKLVKKINSEMADAREEINNGLAEVAKAQKTLKEQKEALAETKSETYDQLAAALTQLDGAVAGSISNPELQAQVPSLQENYTQAERGTYDAIESFADAEAQIEAAESKLASTKSQLISAKEQLDEKADEALEAADLGSTITVDMISGVLQGQNFEMPAGYIQKDDEKYLISVGDEIESIDDVENLYLFNVEGIGDIYLDDVADVYITDNTEEIYASINGSSGVLLTFSKQSNYATANVSNNINDAFEELAAEYEGLRFTMLMDQGEYIYLIIDAILESLLYGALFAVIVLFLFLRDLRPTFITLLSIPISLTFAIVLMYFTGVTINLISLSGLAISVGMLVDNSIVVIENIYRLRRMGVPPMKAAVAGAKEVGGAITASTLTTVCVFFPIIFVQGITRQLFADLALTVGYSLMASLIIALTLVPALASTMIRKDPKPEKAGGVMEGYRRLLNWNLNHKALILVVAVALLAYSVTASLQKGLIFIPDMSTPQMTGTLTMTDEEATLDDTKKAADEAVAIIEKVDGIESVGAMLSSTSEMGSLMGETSNNTVSLYLILDEDSDRSGSEIAKEVEELCKDLPCEVEIISSSSISEYTSALGGSGVSISIYAKDNDSLKEGAEILSEELSKVEGIDEVDNGLEESSPEYHFTVNKKKAMKEGLTVAQVYMAIAEELTYESESTTIAADGKDYDIVVADGDETSVTLKQIKNLEIADGVKVKDVAKVEKTYTLPTINRVNQRTTLTVSGTIKEGYNITLVAADCEEALKNVSLPEGVSYEIGGENDTIMEAMDDLIQMMLLGILFVYLIMVAQFQSLKSPFIVLFTIPLAFTGGLLALIICGKEISVMAMLGLILLDGVIVNNGIVLVDYINQLRAKGLNKRAAIITGGSTRIRPVLMTSFTTIFGLLVMALGKTAGTDMMQPIALVCIGGLTYATALTLLVVPVIYDIFNGEKFEFVKVEDIDVSDLIVE